MSEPLCFKAALRYLTRHGWQSLATCNPNHLGVDEEHAFTCDSPGKRPVSWKWKQWQRTRVTEAELRLQWEIWSESNVGVVLGAVSGLVAVDVDSDAGERLLRSLSRGDLHTAASFTTGRGRRLLYRAPAEPVFTRDLGDGLELLGEGSLTVMPPSLHASGVRYRWRGRREPAPAPEWLLEAARRGAPFPRAFVPAGGEGAAIVQSSPGRNRTLFRMACAVRRHGATEAEILALLQAVNGRCVPPLEERELRAIARSAARYSPAP